MDLKELSESVQQSAPVPLISPKRQIRSRFQLNLDKTIESCKAQLGASPACLPAHLDRRRGLLPSYQLLGPLFAWLE